jgi:hypothetical protein
MCAYDGVYDGVYECACVHQAAPAALPFDGFKPKVDVVGDDVWDAELARKRKQAREFT